MTASIGSRGWVFVIVTIIIVFIHYHYYLTKSSGHKSVTFLDGCEHEAVFEATGTQKAMGLSCTSALQKDFKSTTNNSE